MRRGIRARVLKLLIPLPLAVSIVTAVGLVGRSWHITARPSPYTVAPRQLPPARSSIQPPSHRKIEGSIGLKSKTSAPSQAAVEALGETNVTEQPPIPLPREQLRQQTNISSARPTITHSFRPAPKPVAPSHEAALRASEPPPAVASAPRMAPAPIVPLIPAPEPSAPAQTSPIRTAEPPRTTMLGQRIRSVRFDASYYYGRGRTARGLAEELAQSWADQGVNLVYFYAYNRVYGARYRTRYAGNIMEDFGRQDLLRHMLREAHKRDIRVIAWLNGVQHKQMWEAHPMWREKTADGNDYKPDADSYFLCVRNPEVMQWWLGLLDELLVNYPDLDGIDLAEFQLDLWGDNACHCERCRSQYAGIHHDATIPSESWRQFRADGLTRLILASSRLAHGYGKAVHVTSVFTASITGKLMSTAQVRNAIAFDLEGILDSPDKPDVIQAELIWQQWAALYSDRKTFSPEWTTAAVCQAKEMIRGRAKLIAHLEVTDFGVGALDGPSLARTIACATTAEPVGIDIYDAHLLSQTEGVGDYLQMAWLNPNE